jgi:hypothetical protein
VTMLVSAYIVSKYDTQITPACNGKLDAKGKMRTQVLTMSLSKLRICQLDLQ